MGQEWNASTPFLYFTDFEDEGIAKGVKEGYLQDRQVEGNNPPPLDPQSLPPFLLSKLRWEEVTQTSHAQVLAYYKTLIALRKNLRCLSNNRKDLTQVYFKEEGDWLILIRRDPDGSQAVLIVNFLEEKQWIPVPFAQGRWKLILRSTPLTLGTPNDLPPESLTSYHIPVDPLTALLYIPE